MDSKLLTWIMTYIDSLINEEITPCASELLTYYYRVGR
jgi:hypothetical protein